MASRRVENSPPGKIVRRTSRAATGGAALFLAFLMYMILKNGTGTSTPSEGESGTESPPMATVTPPDDI
ncbi:MAG: hypothetical protein KDA91_25795, partial [Planctomycetaceae bacterium]|nr:hypothetical protein [Planctomycetaceae bacterium]